VRVLVPSGARAELLIVDNASTDEARQLVSRSQVSHLETRYFHEPQTGQARARNRGLAQARGEIILFLDDDVRPSRKWLEGMCYPIVTGQADAVAGTLILPSHLHRPWMQRTHRSFLSSNEEDRPDAIDALIGGNMGFRRSVLEKVPAFDVELGPGALGFWDDILFTRQLGVAGYRLARASEYPAVHHFDPARLSRTGFVQRAKGEGRSQAYVAYHWNHLTIPEPRKELLRHVAQLREERAKHREEPWPHSEGMPAWEFMGLIRLHFIIGYLRERRRPRNYAKHGLVKLSVSASL